MFVSLTELPGRQGQRARLPDLTGHWGETRKHNFMAFPGSPLCDYLTQWAVSCSFSSQNEGSSEDVSFTCTMEQLQVEEGFCFGVLLFCFVFFFIYLFSASFPFLLFYSD